MENKFSEQRRRFFELAGVGLLSGLMTNRVKGADTSGRPFKTLDKNSRIDVGQRGPKIIEKAYRLGYDYEKKHGGCCRCTVAALQHAIGFIPKNEAIFRTACCLDGGATPTGIQNCGAFTGQRHTAYLFQSFWFHFPTSSYIINLVSVYFNAAYLPSRPADLTNRSRQDMHDL